MVAGQSASGNFILWLIGILVALSMRSSVRPELARMASAAPLCAHIVEEAATVAGLELELVAFLGGTDLAAQAGVLAEPQAALPTQAALMAATPPLASLAAGQAALEALLEQARAGLRLDADRDRETLRRATEFGVVLGQPAGQL